MTARATVWIYPPKDVEKKSYVAQWQCACEVPALYPFTSTTATHTLECRDCGARQDLELGAAIDVPNRFGIAPLEIRCPETTCRITTQMWHPLPKGQRIRLSCARCGRFSETAAR
ncbi:MAG TPA: hypothetical protein VHM19_15900 [Polyangiales bacterium]|jgi:hypothetical protein|nr:hypothetical protein [Polyangiales bacterium]